jgi:hypothetical protein
LNKNPRGFSSTIPEQHSALRFSFAVRPETVKKIKGEVQKNAKAISVFASTRYLSRQAGCRRIYLWANWKTYIAAGSEYYRNKKQNRQNQRNQSMTQRQEQRAMEDVALDVFSGESVTVAGADNLRAARCWTSLL